MGPNLANSYSMLSTDTIWKVGKVFQQCYNVIIPKNGSKEGRCAKILVEVDLSKPQIKGTELIFEGEKRWVIFRYEQLPLFFFYCGKIGHGERGWNIKVNDSKNSNLCE